MTKRKVPKWIAMNFLMCLIFADLMANRASANPPTGASITVGASAIGSDIGYAVSIGTPYYNKGKTTIAFQFNQNLFQGLSGNSYQDFNYYIFQFKGINRLCTGENYAFYFDTSAFYTFSYDMTRFPSYGLAFSFGGEFYESSNLSLYSETGWYFPFSAKAEKLENQAFARGISITFGVKFYP